MHEPSAHSDLKSKSAGSILFLLRSTNWPVHLLCSFWLLSLIAFGTVVTVVDVIIDAEGKIASNSIDDIPEILAKGSTR